MTLLEENTATKPSGLRPPSKIPAVVNGGAGFGLLEMSASDHNARSMAPPRTTSLKHKGSALPEPAPKRKTLSERAAEPVSLRTAATGGARSTTTTTSTRPNGAGGVRIPSATLARSASTASRNFSNGSSTSTSRYGVPAHARSRSAIAAQQSRPDGAAATALDDHHDASTEQSWLKKREGTPRALSRSLHKHNDTKRAAPGQALPPHGDSPSTRASLVSPPTKAVFQQLGRSLSSSLSLSFSPPKRSSPSKPPYLTRNSNLLAPVWDTNGRLEDMEVLYSQLKDQIHSAAEKNSGLDEKIQLYQTRVDELEQTRLQLSTANSSLTAELQDCRSQLSAANAKVDETNRAHGFEIDDLRRRHRNELDDVESKERRGRERLERELQEQTERLRRETQDEMDRLNRAKKEELADRERDSRAELEEEKARHARELQELTTQHALSRHTADLDVSQRERELQTVRGQLSETQTSLDAANALVASLTDKLAASSADSLALDTSMRALKAKIDFLESDNQAQSQAFADLHQKMQEAVDAAAEAHEKLRQEESLRRKLHNQVQELKGNIRVFCRVRPTLGDEGDDAAAISFPDAATDCREVTIRGPEQKSVMGTVTTPTSAFNFDRVFGPSCQNAEIFDEISQLVQSALDGYNVCIFCYGQTGSGKTHTMSSLDGMIPRAVEQIYSTATALRSKGWTYTMQGSFVEVYNESVNDLLGRAEEWERKKHEIRQDAARARTWVTDVECVTLDSPARVNELLSQAARNRSVAATKANARSSRSHSVFMLRLTGKNETTGESSDATLNLVDLAGSERLAHSQATGERLRETQSINKSLSCLGDVIGALGGGGDMKHVPYRNSKLTYLLQHSLGGNSKTLMFVMISPLQAHLGETLTSLKFATKVHNTHIGTAKRQAKA